MKLRLLLSAALLLAAAPTIASADTLITCNGNIDNALDSAIGGLSAGGALNITMSGDFCTILKTHDIAQAVSVTITGEDSGGTVIFATSSTSQVFRVREGAQLSIKRMTFESAGQGTIGVFDSTLLIDQMGFLANGSSSGGAISASNSAVTIKRSTFQSNATSLDGGAIAMSTGGSLVVSDSGFSLNQALVSGTGKGGAIYSSGTPVTLDRVLFNANKSSTSRGGAVYINGADLTVLNSTFTSNMAVWGGAIATEDEASHSVRLNNVTLRGDSASVGAGELDAAGTVASAYVINNSLISGVCGGFSASATSHGSIESPGNTCSLAIGTNRVSIADTDLHLGVLANNGGLTSTILPQTFSVMIDTGGSDCEGVDQRDVVRNVGVCDVGALEVGATLSDLIFADTF